MIKNLNSFQKRLKIKFKDLSLLEQALTHKSADSKKNNEKLEFLGDRVIGLILSNKLFDLYPAESEGVLDKKFAKLVNKKTCSEVAWSIGLQDHLILGNSKKCIIKGDEKILSDACEALIGSIFIDKGYYNTKDFVLDAWKTKINESSVIVIDSKTKLQEYSLKHFKQLPIYNLIDSKGPKHNPTYKVGVSIRGSKKYIGSGNSKQAAEQDCAKNLLKGNKIY
jgi:ribonuclease III